LALRTWIERAAESQQLDDGRVADRSLGLQNRLEIGLYGRIDEERIRGAKRVKRKDRCSSAGRDISLSAFDRRGGTVREHGEDKCEDRHRLSCGMQLPFELYLNRGNRSKSHPPARPP
jgi:hypothetical protein